MKKDAFQKSLASRAIDVCSDEGLVSAGRRARAKIGNAFLRSNSAFWYAKELGGQRDAEAAGAGEEGNAGTFALMDPVGLAQALESRKELSWAVDPRELETSASLGHRWTCWKLKGEMVAFCKVGRGKVFIVDFERSVTLPEGLAFVSDVYVFPEFRRKGLARQLLVGTTNWLGQHSVSVVSCHIPLSNVASTKLFISLGFRTFGQIHFLRILGVPIYSFRPEDMLEKMAARDRKGERGIRSDHEGMSDHGGRPTST